MTGNPSIWSILEQFQWFADLNHTCLEQAASELAGHVHGRIAVEKIERP
jgi:hypothetical protein